ncbi:MAG: hypothetical protein AMXMBFR12_01390 [Candidatus Babeliales bacterium]
MKTNLLIGATLFFILPVSLEAMDEPESWNCEFFSFASELLKEMVISIRFRCNEASAADQLFTAIRNNNVTHMVTILQDHPQLLDVAQDSDGITPLLAATILGNDTMVAQILNRQPKVDRCTHQGFSMIPAKDGTAWLPLAGVTPLMVAAKFNRVNIAKQLLSAKANKELTDFSNPPKNALAHAKESGNIEMVNLLQ